MSVRSIVTEHHLRQLGVKDPVLIERTNQGLEVTDSDLVRRIGPNQRYTLVDCSDNIRWLVDSTPGTIAIYS